MLPVRFRPLLLGLPLAGMLGLVLTLSDARAGERLDGFNVVAVRGHPFGSAAARQALATAKRVGAGTVAIIPFLWQGRPDSAFPIRGDDMSDAELRAAIRDAHAQGFTVVVKPHVWIDGSWAGAVEPGSGHWAEWFAGYRRELERIAKIAADEHAEVLAVGTELAKTSQRPEWFELIKAARAIFPGRLVYFAHNPDEAEQVPFWPQLDAVGVTLYPPLGADADRAGRLAQMRKAGKALDALGTLFGKPVIVGEIGIRSALGAAAKPWESAEEREAVPDPLLQAEVLADWLGVLDRPSVSGVLVWRWFSDPNAGGARDTDFTVQGKPAEGVLFCAWTGRCGGKRSEPVPGPED